MVGMAWGFKQVYNGWIRNVAFEKMVADVILTDSCQCTVENIESHDPGHYGIQGAGIDGESGVGL